MEMESEPEIRFTGGAPDNSAVTKLVFFSLLMIILPLTVYFSSKSLFFEMFMGMTSSNSYFYAAIASIFTVHVVLALFIYVAWSEGSKPAGKLH